MKYYKDGCFSKNSTPVGLASESMSNYARSSYENFETWTKWLFYGSLGFAALGLAYIGYLTT